MTCYNDTHLEMYRRREMASKTFYEDNDCTKYEPETVTLNGQRGAIWTRWLLKNGVWVHSGKQFNRLKATRKQITESFNDDY